MTFGAFDLLANGASGSMAFADDTRMITRQQAREIADDIARFLGDGAKKLVMVENPRTVAGVLAYVAALRAGHAVVLVESAGHGDLLADIERLRPDVVLGPLGVRASEASPHYRSQAEDVPHGGVARRLVDACSAELAPNLALVARTSGSTAQGKLVRLSYDNLASNAHSIGLATDIDVSDVVATSLRLDYSFGLSMVNSHLVAGATVGLTTASPTTERFWADVGRLRVTCFGMVPSTVRFILQHPDLPTRLSSMRSLLVAGGPLKTDFLRQLRAAAGPSASVYYMYGQTEATARMTCLPPTLADEHEGSVGLPVFGGRIRIRGVGGEEVAPGQPGEVCYLGPNVMLGYAITRDDLALPALGERELRTGDVGRLKDGVLYLEGRVDRQIKILGEKVNLDAVEAAATSALDGVATAAVFMEPDEVHLFVEGDSDCLKRLRSRGSAGLGVPLGCLKLRTVTNLPKTPSGKVKYFSLS
ncbi:AMP-binding protein [Streptomyces sp. AC550_RSS872]|uniref:AMP-binding protein n=1 Tax=Streptomyces sp. AC550_RSS872 TaxID=2823689 RepID=UPI001C27004C|nr:AMP-binding protein [Streptomyces sp. AC550_RSS872]